MSCNSSYSISTESCNSCSSSYTTDMPDYSPDPLASIPTNYGMLEKKLLEDDENQDAATESGDNYKLNLSYVFLPEQNDNTNAKPVYEVPEPQIVKNNYETFYSLHSANSIRIGGKTIVIPRILGFMDPADESGSLRTYSAGGSLPFEVTYSVDKHEERHNRVRDEWLNRDLDKAEGTDLYESF